MILLRAFFGTIIFLILLLLIYAVHVRLFPVNVVFYSALIDAVIAASIGALLLFSLRFFQPLSSLERILLIIIWILVGYSFAISVPTVIDRSLSFYILEKIQQRGGGIERDAFEQVFTDEYMKEYRLVDVRLTEQLESGTITIDGDCVRLTNKGDQIASLGQYFRRNWLPRQRLLMGEYTDALTDPFRESRASVDYTC